MTSTLPTTTLGRTGVADPSATRRSDFPVSCGLTSIQTLRVRDVRVKWKPMRRRGCMTIFLIFILLAVICCGTLWFVGVPRFRNSISDEIANNLSTQVSEQLGGTSIGAGTHTLDVEAIQREFAANLNTDSIDNVEVSVTSSEISLSFKSGGQQIGYTGTPTVENGKLVVNDMKVDNDVLGFILPGDKLASAIEDGVNDYFAAQGLQIDSLQLGNGEITFETSPAP